MTAVDVYKVLTLGLVGAFIQIPWGVPDQAGFYFFCTAFSAESAVARWL